MSGNVQSDDDRSSASTTNLAIFIMDDVTVVDEVPSGFSGLTASLPISDRTSIVGVSNIDVRTRASARADEYRRVARGRLSISNAVTPIHRLPLKILAEIFKGCWVDRESLRIGHVCRLWRSVLLDTKRFWVDAVKGRNFSPDDPSVGYLGMVLERSAPCMVELSFSSFSTSAASCLAPHAERLLSLDLSFVTHRVLSPLWTCLNSGMPCLATLTITLDGGDFWWITNAPFGNLSLSPTALPRLTQVSAPVGLLPSLALPSLQHVTLNNPMDPERPHGRLESECFRETLTVCAPNLRTLVLAQAAPRLHTTATPLSLPSLQYLRVQDTTHHCALILFHLVLPNTTHIHCTTINSGGLTYIVPPTSGPIQSAIRATDRVAIIGTPKTTSVHCYAGNAELLCVDAEPLRANETLRLRPNGLDQLFRSGNARIKQLTVSGIDPEEMQSVEWHAFPHLVQAEIRGRSAKHALGSLVRRVDGLDFHAGAVCPWLGTLAVDFHFGLQQRDMWRRADNLGNALRKRDAFVVEADLRKRCTELERVLSLRSQMGTRLRRLEFGCTERNESTGLDERKSVLLKLSASSWVYWEPIVEPLERLVDGPVVFTGYRYFLADG